MNQERVIVQPPPPDSNDPEPATCFAITHPLHGEPFSRSCDLPESANFYRQHAEDSHEQRADEMFMDSSKQVVIY